jgi:tRNA G18 (ribose-2'-O)-methylase SpoU
MKGYFGIGVEGVSKAMNVGTLFRTAHAFGAAFVFTLRAQYNRREGSLSDTSDTPRSVPTYNFASLEAFRLPQGCRLVGVEITDSAIELPSFRHPRQAAYILGAEREGLSADVQSICDYVVKIPTRFSVNLGVAGALIMYDRQLSLGRHAPRPVAEGGPTELAELPVFGEPIYKRKQRIRARAAQARK